MKRRFATAVTAGTLGTASVLGIGLVAPAARAGTDQGSETVSQDSGDDDSAGGTGGPQDSGNDAAHDDANAPLAAVTSPADLVSSGYQVASPGSTAADPAAGILGPGGTNLQTSARVLGMDLTSLQEELRAGATLGDLARARGVEQVALVRALAQEQESRLERWL